MRILFPLIVIMVFGGMGLLLIQAGRSKLKILNKQDVYGSITSIQALVAIFQIGVGCVGILISINQIILFMIEII